VPSFIFIIAVNVSRLSNNTVHGEIVNILRDFAVSAILVFFASIFEKAILKEL